MNEYGTYALCLVFFVPAVYVFVIMIYETLKEVKK
jgi:hypothetical protein